MTDRKPKYSDEVEADLLDPIARQAYTSYGSVHNEWYEKVRSLLVIEPPSKLDAYDLERWFAWRRNLLTFAEFLHWGGDVDHANEMMAPLLKQYNARFPRDGD